MKQMTEEEVTSMDELDLCRFCYLDKNERLIWEGRDTYVVPTVGCFVEGYVLLVHQEHLECFGEDVSSAAVDTKQRLRRAMERIYGDCTFYEHGRTGSCFTKGECKINFHAHTHCVPGDLDLQDQIDISDPIEVDEWKELPDLASENPEYLYVEPASGQGYFFPVSEQIPRQFLRRRACEALGVDTAYADWREYPFRDKMAHTADKLSPEVDASHNSTGH